MSARFLAAMSSLLVCAGILLLREVRFHSQSASQPQQAIVKSDEQPRRQVASPATSAQERDAERPLTESASANRIMNAIQRRTTGQEQVDAERLDTPTVPDDNPNVKYIPGRAVRIEIALLASDIVYGHEKATPEQAKHALEVVDSVLSDYPEYEHAMAVGVTAACLLGDVTRARQYISRMKTAAEGGRQKCKELGVEL